jgi:hypothetical protein
MFLSAYSFNQPLNEWSVSKDTEMNFLFDGARLRDAHMPSYCNWKR